MADIGDPYTGIAELYKNINEHKNFNIDCNILCRRHFCFNYYGKCRLTTNDTDKQVTQRKSTFAVLSYCVTKQLP